MKIIMATGREIEVYRVIKGGMLDYLHIYVNTLTPAEIYEIFDNPAETETITAIKIEKDGEETRRVYEGYTYLYSVQKPFLKSPEGTKMIWLQRPEEQLS